MIKINPNINIEAASRDFQTKGFAQIDEFFTPDSAAYLLNLIQQNKHWSLAYNDANGFYESALEDFEQMPTDRQTNFMKLIHQRASEHFQYCFIQYYITNAINLGEHLGDPLHQLESFLNSEPYLNLAKAITADDTIANADSYVSRYEPGHFLTEHDDTHATQDRVAACTFGMTPKWRPDWGGHLVFYDDKGNIIRGLKPGFNTFTIFAIPQSHAVQCVSPSASEPRLSILSWLKR